MANKYEIHIDVIIEDRHTVASGPVAYGSIIILDEHGWRQGAKLFKAYRSSFSSQWRPDYDAQSLTPTEKKALSRALNKFYRDPDEKREHLEFSKEYTRRSRYGDSSRTVTVTIPHARGTRE